MRINLFAGPGAGKSTTAALLFSKMKISGYSVELVSEFVKSWAVAKRPVTGFDQVYLAGKQLHYEYRFLSNGIEHIITDSPVLLSACYTRAFYNGLSSVADSMENICLEYEKQHPAINIFLERGTKKYVEEGRYQTEDQAKDLDLIVKNTLDRLNIGYETFSFFDSHSIFNYITKTIDENKNKAEA